MQRDRLYGDILDGAIAGLFGGGLIMILILLCDALLFEPLATSNFPALLLIDGEGLTVCTILFGVTLQISSAEVTFESRWLIVPLANFIAGDVIAAYLKIRALEEILSGQRKRSYISAGRSVQ
jgi:hypothetical protein